MIDLPTPAIIQPVPLVEVRFGLSVAPSRVELDRFRLPADWRDARLSDLVGFLPDDLRSMPDWIVQGMLPGLLPLPGVASGAGVKTTVILTATSGSNQTWPVLSDWNSMDNRGEVVGGGGAGGGRSAQGTGGGGGGGAYGRRNNMSLTPGGSATYFLNAGAAGNAGTGAAGSDAWFNGASLGASSVGAKGGAGGGSSASDGSAGAGGVGTSGVGDIRRDGGAGAAGSSGSRGGGGGGAAGNSSAGGNASAGAGGQANGSGAAGGFFGLVGDNGTEWQSSPARGSGGGGGGGNGPVANGANGGSYGGAGGGAVTTFPFSVNGGNGAQAIIVITNNASL